MRIYKVINNNLVKSKNERGQSILVMGCGLGYLKKPGELVDEARIEEIYTALDTAYGQQVEELLAEIPVENLQTANEMIRYAKAALGVPLNDSIYLTLTDHITCAAERARRGILLKNALLWEIQKFYSREYAVARGCLSLMEQRLHVSLPDDEAGFITLHLVNATMAPTDVGTTAEITRAIQRILSIVQYHFHREIDENSLHYERFVTHLKFFVQRVFTDAELSDDDDSFLQVVRQQYKNEYLCALKVRDYMAREYGKALTEDEIVYLTVHLRRILPAGEEEAQAAK